MKSLSSSRAGETRVRRVPAPPCRSALRISRSRPKLRARTSNAVFSRRRRSRMMPKASDERLSGQRGRRVRCRVSPRVSTPGHPPFSRLTHGAQKRPLGEGGVRLFGPDPSCESSITTTNAHRHPGREGVAGAPYVLHETGMRHPHSAALHVNRAGGAERIGEPRQTCAQNSDTTLFAA